MGGTVQRNRSKMAILAMVLLLPGFLYIAVNKLGTNEYVSLPVFGEKRLSGEMKRNWGREYPDTVFHTLPMLEFGNYAGDRTVFPAPDSAVITVAHLFYTKDRAFSRIMIDHVDGLSDRFRQNPMVRFYSISADPTESPEGTKTYLKPYRTIAEKHWKVVFDPSADIFRYAKEQMLIDAMADPDDPDRFLIASQFVLIDSRKRIRGFYDIGQKGETDRLEDEIKLLLVEEIRNRPQKVESANSR